MNNLKEQYMDEHLPKRLLLALAFASLFIVIGLMFPDIYYHYLDQTEYYTVSQPIPVAQKWYKPCDDVVMTALRTSKFDVSGIVQTDLVLKRGSNEIFKVPNVKFNRGISVKKGENVTVSFAYRLPCELADGTYYWQLSFSYKVRGFDKNYTAISDLFNVNQYGVDPDLLKAATESAQFEREPVRDPSVRVIIPSPEPKQESNQSNQGSHGSGDTTINNYQSQPNPTPQPTPTQKTQVCVPILGCIR